MTPIAVLVSSQWYPSNAFDAQWELAHDGLAVMLGLFGLVYRYAVRQDPNPQVCSLCAPREAMGEESWQSTCARKRACCMDAFLGRKVSHMI